MQTTRNFRAYEFQCSCCDREEMDQGFIDKLQIARDIAGIPFRINSGWRCEKHNKEVGGAEKSSHLTGHAADMQADTLQKRFAIVSALIKAGFGRIGIDASFIHVDDDAAKSQSVMWLYIGGRVR